MSFLITYFVWFMFYSFVGWVWEVIVRSIEARKFVNSGFLNGPYCPIYGVGAVLFILLFGWINNPILLFFACGVIACILEYITSWGMEKLFHMRWWDYSKDFLNINGRVCLKGFLAFGALGTLLILFIQPPIANITAMIPEKILSIIALVLFATFLTDFVYTVSKLTEFNAKLKHATSEFNATFEKSRKQTAEMTEKARQEFHDKWAARQAELYKRLNLNERRLVRNFPKLRSTRYDETLQKIKEQYHARKKGK